MTESIANLRRGIAALQVKIDECEKAGPVSESARMELSASVLTAKEVKIFEATFLRAETKHWGEMTNKGALTEALDLVAKSRAEYEVLCEFRHQKEVTRRLVHEERILLTKKRFGTLKTKK